jgi:hypothetical protein
MYAEILNREPDPEGLANHIKTLRSGTSKLTIAVGMMQSHEAASLFQHPISERTKDLNSISEIVRQMFALKPEPFIRQLYGELFSRKADAAGFQNFVNKLQAGHSRHSILIEMLLSREFASLMALNKHAFAKENLDRLIQSFYS